MVGVHRSASPPFSCEPAAQVPIQAASTAQGISLPGLFLRGERSVELYICLCLNYSKVLGSKVIWNTGCSTVPYQVVHGEEAEKDNDQAGYMPR